MATPNGTSSESVDLENQPWEDFLISDHDLIPYSEPHSTFRNWELFQGLGGFGHSHSYYQYDGRRRVFTRLRDLLPYVWFNDLRMLYHQMHNYYSAHPDNLVGRDVYYDLQQLLQDFDAERTSQFWQDQDSWVVYGWTLFERSSVHVVQLITGRHIYMYGERTYPLRELFMERMLLSGLHVPPSHHSNRVATRHVVNSVRNAWWYARQRRLRSL